jgi:hypothetical protein
MELKTLKDSVWDACSLHVRHKYADKNGNIACYTCPAVKPLKEMQAGHGIGNRSNAKIFDLRIIRPQCIGCNIFQHGRYDVFTRKLIKEYGEEGYDQIAKECSQTKNYSEEELWDLLINFSDHMDYKQIIMKEVRKLRQKATSLRKQAEKLDKDAEKLESKVK